MRSHFLKCFIRKVDNKNVFLDLRPNQLPSEVFNMHTATAMLRIFN